MDKAAPPLHRPARPPVLAPSERDIDNHPVVFTGSGAEYFRIWIVNLLLTVLTLGIYLPWAKVRKLRYFYGNTFIDGHPLDFHGEPRKMLRGTLIVGFFFLAYSYASDLSPLATLVSLTAFMIVWPPLYRASLRFRLANTSWRGMRLRMEPASLREVYLCLTPPNLLLFAPLLYWSFGADHEEVLDVAQATGAPEMALWLVPTVSFGLFILSLPYFLWRMNRYRINHAAWGDMRMQFRSGPAEMYRLFIGPLLIVLALLALVVGTFYLYFTSLGRGEADASVFVVLAFLMPFLVLAVFLGQLLVKAYLAAGLQNLLWSRTGNHQVRFKSLLSPWRYLGLQLKNHLLIGLTLGLYWPFAAVANRRMQLEAVTLRSRTSLDAVADQARRRETDAAGDAAADLFDVDLGM